MFKNRYFILGLGLGFILCGTLLVLYGGYFITNNSTELTLEELKVIANEKNLYIYSEEELNELIKVSNNKYDKDKAVNDEENKNSVEGEFISFTIPYGFDTYQVTELLFNIGILEDKQEFNTILVKNHLTKGIIAGDYKYNLNLSTQELIELITNTELDN